MVLRVLHKAADDAQNSVSNPFLPFLSGSPWQNSSIWNRSDRLIDELTHKLVQLFVKKTYLKIMSIR